MNQEQFRHLRQAFKKAILEDPKRALGCWEQIELLCQSTPEFEPRLKPLFFSAALGKSDELFARMLQSAFIAKNPAWVETGFEYIANRSDPQAKSFYPFLKAISNSACRSEVLTVATKANQADVVEMLLKEECNITRSIIRCVMDLNLNHMLPLFTQALNKPHITINPDECLRFALQSFERLDFEWQFRSDNLSSQHKQNRLILIDLVLPKANVEELIRHHLLYSQMKIIDLLIPRLNSTQWQKVIQSSPKILQTELGQIRHNQITKDVLFQELSSSPPPSPDIPRKM